MKRCSIPFHASEPKIRANYVSRSRQSFVVLAVWRKGIMQLPKNTDQRE